MEESLTRGILTGAALDQKYERFVLDDNAADDSGGPGATGSSSVAAAGGTAVGGEAGSAPSVSSSSVPDSGSGPGTSGAAASLTGGPGGPPGRRVQKALDRDEGVEVSLHFLPKAIPGQPSEFGSAMGDGAAAAMDLVGRLRPHLVRHDRILSIVDAWEEADRYVYVTEVVTSGTLREYVKRVGDNMKIRVVRKWAK